MSQLTEESDEGAGYILMAKMDNARNLANVLKAIHFKDVSIISVKAVGSLCGNFIVSAQSL